jgi:hypothetical protein
MFSLILEPIDLPLIALPAVWFALVLAYLAFRAVPCFAGDVLRRFRARHVFRAELQKSGLVVLSATLKMTALSLPRVAHHAPWAWAVPLVFLAFGPLLKRWRNRPRATRYTRAIRAAERTPRER